MQLILSKTEQMHRDRDRVAKLLESERAKAEPDRGKIAALELSLDEMAKALESQEAFEAFKEGKRLPRPTFVLENGQLRVANTGEVLKSFAGIGNEGPLAFGRRQV